MQDNNTIAICPKCRTPIQSDSIYCDICGENLSEVMSAATIPYTPPTPGTSECEMCGFANPPRTNFCEFCGAQLGHLPAENSVPVPAAPDLPPKIPELEALENKERTIEPPTSQPQDTDQGEVVEPQVETSAAPIEKTGLSQAKAAPQPAQPSPIAGYFLLQPKAVSIKIPTNLEEVIIGREDIVSNIYPDIDLGPYDGLKKGIGRKHLRLVYQGTQAFIEDLQTVNGSHLNGKRLSPNQRVPIQDGDELILGRMKLIFKIG